MSRVTDLIDTRAFIYWIDPCSWVKGKGHRISIVFENEDGHYPTGGGDVEPWYWGDPENCAASLKLAEETAEKANAERGIDKKRALMIMVSSMRLSSKDRYIPKTEEDACSQ